MRKINADEFVEELYIDIVERKNDTKYLFFIGAGCSVSSGIPSAKELSKEWANLIKILPEKNKWLESIGYNNCKSADFYFDIFEKLFPDSISQQREIMRVCSGANPSFGYYMLATLIYKYSQFNVVLTTNFDDLLSDTLSILKLDSEEENGKESPLIITHYSLSNFIDRSLKRPIIVKIHGDSHLSPANNKDMTEELDNKLIDNLKPIVENSKIIFLGYGGGDESISHMFRTIGVENIYNVYWVGSKSPIDTELKRWWNELIHKTHVERVDFDILMSKFQKKFNLKEPDFTKIAEKLKKHYNSKESQIPENEMEIIEKATEAKNKNIDEEAEKIFKKGLKQFKDSERILIAYELFLFEKGDYEEAIKTCDKIISINPKSNSVYNNKAENLNKIGKYQEALNELDKEFYIIKTTIYEPDLYANRAYSLAKLGKLDEAKIEVEKAININPRRYSIGYYIKSIICILENKINKALENLELAIRYRDDWKDRVKKDDDFKELWNNPEFKKLIGENNAK